MLAVILVSAAIGSGSEMGTAASPIARVENVADPIKVGMSLKQVKRILSNQPVHENLVFGLPAPATAYFPEARVLIELDGSCRVTSVKRSNVNRCPGNVAK
jgi:hypothetical protein